MNHYDQSFFQTIDQVSRSTAKKIIPHLLKLVEPKSIVDVGCGTGAWLKTCKDLGVNDLRGYDGEWASQMNVNGGFGFMPADVSRPIQAQRRFDLAMSIEVGEHLPEPAAATLVASLASMSDVIIFSAAVPGQGGTNHLNEQWPPFWMGLFREHGFTPFDCIRAPFWDDAEVDACVAQNAFLYVKEGSQFISSEIMERIKAASIPRPLSAVNPRLFNDKLKLITTDLDTISHFLTLRMLIKLFPRLLGSSLAHHGKKLFGGSKGNA